MSAYSETTFDSKHYDDTRPNYPEAFYKELLSYHSAVSKGDDSRLTTAVDLGSGSGFVTFKLLDYFKKVYGVDPSCKMIMQCKESEQFEEANAEEDRIDFHPGTGEFFTVAINNHSVDLITAGESSHWFDHPLFFKEANRALKPNGTLAFWLYKDPVFIGHPKANEIYTNYTYNSSIEKNPDDGFEKWMGPYYQQPGHDYLRTLMKEIEVPEDLYYDIQRVEYISERDGVPDNFDPKAAKTKLFIHKKITVKWFHDYVKSWSAYHSWMKEHGEKYDIADKFVDELKEASGWQDDTELDVVWDTVYTFARRK
ncbi:trans-aconitate methyltransferase 1 [Scheffersomyces stipitis CBS 6054]|uniref:Trans-aconitate methyltransferase 1 n=1 Tax=Scheffersomyces stipitis (strain ATCC 58785 / CBS 6054 / NBRC 10063 / NRRL Y-11545) TaxID=322104 RepID=A3GFT7_PICST|nr:trans-aconitate methyltransferase 1 [Scheffersomyces stipitis CBS 6054]EAZ63816.2 trans-aconitate methyltransferase 1 [Scheffersomyces stipitis CBS 6054]KAG2735231.1 hypothetical protein G9P44_001445 [Scheffersomyces stipitis]